MVEWSGDLKVRTENNKLILESFPLTSRVNQDPIWELVFRNKTVKWLESRAYICNTFKVIVTFNNNYLHTV